jgi:hypothetical protein
MGRRRKWEPRPCRKCRRTIPKWRRSDAEFCSEECRRQWLNERARERRGGSGRGRGPVDVYAPRGGAPRAQNATQEVSGRAQRRRDTRRERDRPDVRLRIHDRDDDPTILAKVERAREAKRRSR